MSIIEILDEIKPEIVLLTETHLNDNTGVNIHGYRFFGRARTDKSGGGVGILIKEEEKLRLAPHTSDKDIEILWVSIDRAPNKPLYIGVYYGRQETGVNKEEIINEIEKLKEEILEVQGEGDMILMMDGNGKIGLMNEKKSRNGILLNTIFEQTECKVMNKSEVCHGIITRQNRKKLSEKSAIDLVIASHNAEMLIQKITIDEEGLFRFKGKSESDHNTILVEISTSKAKKQTIKSIDWRMKAPEEKWSQYRILLGQSQTKIEKIMQDTRLNINKKFECWKKTVENAAFLSIGKSTYKNNLQGRYSHEVMELKKKKREAKNEFLKEKETNHKKEKLEQYKKIQVNLREQMDTERKQKVKRNFQRMMESKNGEQFWKERRKLGRDTTAELYITKDEDGKRVYGAEKNMENIAKYYEKLYSKQNKPYHPFHDILTEDIKQMYNDRNYENAAYNQMPNLETIKEIIDNKKNGKSTTDLRNEFLKKGGKEMVNLLLPLLELVWSMEEIPEKWNEGLITSIWKKKGDKEMMRNQRGITVSSAVSMILEEILNQKITENINITQSQGGGKKGSMTCDHLFIIRAITSMALKKRTKFILTFYDVQKAYDHADVSDMLKCLWDEGIRGKVWRLTKKMNENLSARAKTKYGLTRSIKRQMGGKQGGKTMTTMFSKLMDVLAEDLLNNEKTSITIGMTRIPALLWVDDVMTVALGKEQQIETLDEVNEFAKKHKLTWGADKCNVMELGRHKNVTQEWTLGSDKIQHSATYKYLGDIVSRNGSNTDNIEERERKVKFTTVNVITCARQEIMKRIEISILLKLHEAVTIPTMIHNCESWILTGTDLMKLERIEVWALKRLLNLPEKTPTVAIRFVTGTLYTKIRIQNKQMIYLQKLLQKDNDNWQKQILTMLDTDCIGWAKMIRELLREYHMEENWDQIKQKSMNQWKSEVKLACEKRNREMLLSECEKREGTEKSLKTKSKTIHEIVANEQYERKPLKCIVTLDKLKAKAIVMARYGMLDCSTNYKMKYGRTECKECKVKDDEQHRINFCIKYKGINKCDNPTKFHFQNVYANDSDTLKQSAAEILKIWDLENGKNVIRSEGT